jgi:serine/threonine protein kinase
MAQKFKRFGKYLILDHLVDGGMAKICRARYLGENANKVVAIKMVQPQFSKDPSFVKMFQDELSVTFGLEHSNIAKVFDYGKVDDQLYTAMEYVDGVNLKQILDRLKEKSFVFPVEISVYIISQVCQALFYAHNYTDKLTGKKLNIVHRDISPHNIMVSYDGLVKVIDFGIAKANTNSEATQAGTIKGKLSYLAPEYLEGLELDARYDMFAVGITLWELLCSRKLFQASNDLAVLKLIQACKIVTPSTINPNVPKELDAVAMKALSKDRTLRYEDMQKFDRALLKFLYSNYPEFNPADLSYFVRELFKEEITKDKEKFVVYGKIDVSSYLEDMAKGDQPREKEKNDENSSSNQEPPAVPRVELDLNYNDKNQVKIELNKDSKTKKATPPTPKNYPTKEATVVIKNSDLQSLQQQPPEPTKVHQVKPAVKEQTIITRKTNSRTKIEVENTPSGGSKITIFIGAASIIGFMYFQSSLVESVTGINLRKIFGQTQTREISSVKPEPKIVKDVLTSGKVNFTGLEAEMEIYVNGEKKELSGITLEVPLNVENHIAVRKKGFYSFVSNIQLTSDKSSAMVEVPALEKAKIGLLRTSQNFRPGSNLSFNIKGEKISYEIPLASEILVPVGEYEGTVSNSLLGTEQKIRFKIEENKNTFLE